MKFLRHQTLTIIFAILLLSVPAAWTYRLHVFDWWQLRSYQPPAEIAALAERTTMTNYARKLFYVHKAELSDKETFSEHCSNVEHTIVLGCYVANKGIYIYDVTDRRLAGVKEVTAAHEVLHAAYDRLSKKERESIDKQLLDVFHKRANERIKKILKTYESQDVSIVPSELHSILGTEMRLLPVELESYYARYFHDRQQVVAYAEQYSKAFSERREKIAAYDAELTQLKGDIEDTETSLMTRATDLRAERQKLELLLQSGDYEEYNNRVPRFNMNVSTYNTSVSGLRKKVRYYNALLAERNAIALESNELLQALDSQVTTINTR